MPTSTPPADPDSLAILHALSRNDLSPEDAYNALEGIRHMAGRAITAALDAQRAASDARFAALDSKIDAQRAEIATLRWLLGVGLTSIAVVIAVVRWIGA